MKHVEIPVIDWQTVLGHLQGLREVNSIYKSEITALKWGVQLGHHISENLKSEINKGHLVKVS
jgi:hypothetical protein